MKICWPRASILCGALLLAACGGPPADRADGSVVHLKSSGDVAATIAGTRVPAALVDAVAKGRGLDPADPQQYERALEDTIEYVLLARQADRLNIAQQQDLAAMAEAARLQGVANAVLLAYGRQHPITDAMLAEDYARQVKDAGSLTYRFTQVLFYNREDAEKAAAELAGGGSFDHLGEAWRDRVVDFRPYAGVFPQQLPAPLGEALVKLAPGETSAPVESHLGWHLLHLDGTDEFHAPPLEEVIDTVRRGMQQKQVDAWLETLRKAAAVDIGPKGRTIPLRGEGEARPAATPLPPEAGVSPEAAPLPDAEAATP